MARGVHACACLIFLIAGGCYASAQEVAPTGALSPSGQFVAMQDSTGSIWLLNSASSQKKILVRQKQGVRLDWSANEDVLLAISNGSVESYEMPSGKLSGSFTGSAPFSDPQVSPDGLCIAALRQHNLWVWNCGSRGLKALTTEGSEQLFIGEPDPVFAYEFSTGAQYWWAPDSSAIAFIETKFPNAEHYPLPGAKLPIFHLKVIDVKTGAVRAVAESNDEWPYLLRIAWHPDSKGVAFYRMNRLQNTAELFLSDGVHTQKILTEKDAYWVNAPATPLFLSDGKQLAVTSERSGHRHVYLYGLDGALIRDLTPEDLEVSRLFRAVDANGGLYVSGSTGDHQNQFLYRLDSATVAAKQVTSEPGWHDVTLSLTGNAYLDCYSTSVKPAAVWWHAEKGDPRLLAQSPVKEKSVANEFLPIKTHDNVLIPARLFKPDNFDPQKRYPLIIYTLSGPPGRVVSDSWGGWQMAWNRSMVRKGYLVLAVDVRGSGGYAHLFEEYIHYRFGAQETADIREVVSYLRRQTFVDSARLGIWGCDYGAHTVVHAMLEFPGGFKAGFADSPITDWRQYDAYFTERYLGLPARRVNEYDDSSALENAKRITGELLVAASSKNPLIRPAHLEELQTAMAEAKQGAVAKRLHVLTMKDADYRNQPSQLAALLAAMTEFFDEKLSVVH